jgi:hypothetical protein
MPIPECRWSSWYLGKKAWRKACLSYQQEVPSSSLGTITNRINNLRIYSPLVFSICHHYVSK